MNRAAGTRAALVALLASGLLAVGCGEDNGDDDPAPVAQAQGGDDNGGRVVIESDNGAFSAQAVYDSAAPGVVTVTSIFAAGTSPLAGPGPQVGQGSGFVISDDGEIVTNAHVVTDGEARDEGQINAARDVFVQFPDRNSVEAEIVGFDPFADIALLKIDPDGLDLQPVELGEIDDVEVGEPVAAIGSPFGERQSLSVGVVSATDRAIPSLTPFDILGAIQTDASINPGNSGGPLLDSDGRVIGINQQIDTTSGGNQGVGFAVPIDLAERSIEDLRETGEVAYAFLGVGTKPLFPQLAERLEVDADAGAIVEEVEPDSPAAEAGIEEGTQDIDFQGVPYAVGGDIIVSADGQEILAEADLAEIVSRLRPGDVIEFEVIRDGERETIDVELVARPS